MRNVPAAELDQDFLSALQGEDELGVVIRGHIHIEAGINDFIDAMMPHPDQLPNLRYQQKVELACALGLGSQHAPALRVLGELRNAFAHKLSVGISREAIGKLRAALSESDRAAVETAYHATNRAVLAQDGAPFQDLPPQMQFALIAITLKGMLTVAVRNVRSTHGAP